MSRGRCLLAVVLACLSLHAQAELPLDVRGIVDMPNLRNRVYVVDVAINHIADGRLHVVDGDTGKYLGLIGTGFAGHVTLSPDKSRIYVATTFLSRLQRGERTDVIEVHDSATLKFLHEIVIEPRRAQALPYRGYLRTSADGKYLYVLNATPAVSVSVVDLQQRKQVAEIDAAGCWGIYPAARHNTRFSMLCGDGTVATFTLGSDGSLPAEGGRQNSDKLFDPQDNALFVHAEQDQDRYWFVSFKGDLVALDLGEAKALQAKRLSLVGQSAPKQMPRLAWRPGGYAPLALDIKRGQMFVAMHDGAKEGSHKSPAKEIWVVDLNTGKRTARLPGQAAIALHTPASGDQKLYAIDGIKNGLVVMSGPQFRVKHRVTPVGDASVLLESQ